MAKHMGARGELAESQNAAPWEEQAGALLSAETWRRLAEAASVTVWAWLPHTDVVFHSAGSERYSGQGATLDDTLNAIHPEDRARVKRRLRAAARRGGAGTFRFRDNGEEQALRHFSATFFTVGEERPAKRVEIIVQDVTQAALTETALRESVDHYRTAVELNPEIPWLADPDGCIIEIGPRWLEVADLQPEAGLGRGWLKALHADDVEATNERWQHSFRTGEPVDVEYRIRSRDGQYRWMRARGAARRDAEGRILRWYGTLEDIHDRRVAVTALRESEEFARSILESATSAIEVLDAEGRLIFMNAPGLKLMEVDDFDAIRNRPFDTFWPENVAPAVREAMVKARNGEIARRTLFGPTAKQTPRWWDLSISPILDAEGKVARLLALSRDVTEAKRNEVEIAAASRRLAKVLESTMDSVISLDRDWRITYMNKRALALFSSREPVLGKDLRELLDADSEPFFERYLKAMDEQTGIAFEDYLPSLGAWLEVQAHGSPTGLIIFFRDVTERRRAQEQIAHLARHDALTGLPNRTQFHERLETVMQRPQEGAPMAVLAVDLDDFKTVNDTLGHLAGDALLRGVAQRLKEAAGEHGFAARLGGDEFAVLLEGHDADAAAMRAQAILDALAPPIETEGRSLSVGASIGIALAPRDGTTADTVLHCADLALYRVKAMKGRDFRFYEPQMDQVHRERREMKRELALALKRDELFVVYQPQIEIGSNRLIGFEALLRWTSAKRGSVAPSSFIPLAEECGLIEDISTFVLTQACAEAARWPEGLSLAVNLSPAQFRGRGVLKAVTEALSSSGLAPGRLEIEITESVLLNEASGTVEVLEGLHRAGVRVALDDFGTGYSSLSYLRRFAFDKIKVDRSFVSDLPRAEGSVAIVRAILGLARAMKTRVTAEGVETFEQLMFLAEEGCSEAQGYLFSRPLPADQARQLAFTRQAIARNADLSARRSLG